MNLFDLLDDARELANGIGDTVQGLMPDSSADKGATGADLWSGAFPRLKEALSVYERKDSPSLPDTAWFGRESKASCQKDLDEIVDSVILVLETSGASKCRAIIRARLKVIVESRERIGNLREESLSAPPLASIAITSSLWTRSCESFEARIAAEELSIKVVQREIEQLKSQFRSHLRQIGLEVSPEEVDSLVFPVHYGIVSMAAAILNISRLTTQLERLIEESRECPSDTRRYYGMYVLLAYAIDRLQTHFMDEIDDSHLPKLFGCEQKAHQYISEAKTELSLGGSREVLAANVAANKRVIEACHLLADSLSRQKALVATENMHTRRMLAVAVNTYKTVRLSLNVAELMSDCREAYRALRQLKVPPLRPFQDLRLKEELNWLAQHMSEEES